ncbi:hypothetical protein [Deinococcus marmoris]|uniref:Beta-lactamase n=1 Tax=Deinococcus marmoris TaxID=249408 RepID=A0A1U7NWL9_9DEIO|nr:hypothetical protein [Deinococcus marmoris]OLV17297.1 Beta-lactamase [Deinococcus marmoris]OLV18642.1 Beta-lactamase [Deinococcus marmoris]
MHRSLLTLTTIALMASTPAQAQTLQTLTQAKAITRLLSAPEIKAEWFSPDFLAQVSFETVAAQLQSVSTTYGKFIRLDTIQDRPLAIYERGTLVITAASLDGQGKLTAFGTATGPASMAADPAAARGEQAKVATLLEKLFRSDPLDLSLINPSFLEQASAEDLTTLFASIRAEYGALQDVQIADGGYRLTFEKGQWDATSISLDGQGRFTGLLLRPAEPEAAVGSSDEAALQLTSLFKTDPVDVSRFSPEFLAEAKTDDIRALFASIRAQFGTLQKVDPQGAGWRLTFEKGAWDVTSFKVDVQGRISSFFLRPVPPEVSYKTLAEARAVFAALPG